jgi:hypothetical protein
VTCAWGCGAKTDLGVPEREDAPSPSPISVEGCDEIRHDRAPPRDVPTVDVLFVIDNSNSMEDEQIALASAFPAMATALVTGDIDGDAVIDFPPIRDLHVGVVTTDLGLIVNDPDTGMPAPYECFGIPALGDDGLLEDGSRGPAECPSIEGYFASFDGDHSVEGFVDDFACRARVGVGGCGVFEQPLEAALKALTPASSPLRFAGDTVAHGDGLNDGFLRRGAVLAIFVLTDEDDGSLADGAWLDVATEEAAVLGDAWLHPLARYEEGLARLDSTGESGFVFGAIAGVPIDLVAASAADPVDYDVILSDPRMQRVYDAEEEGIGLVPSCVVEARGRAYPPRRIVSLARELGDQALVQSICQSDFRPALTVLAERLGEVVERVYCADGEAVGP